MSKKDTFFLTEKLYNRFIKLHQKHLNAWETEERIQQHSLENIEKITYNSVEDIFYVYYKKTDHYSETWYHYDTNRGVWW